jgi:hypothetical protein
MIKTQLLICVFSSPGWKKSPYEVLCQRNSIVHVKQTQVEMVLDAFTFSLPQTTVTLHVGLTKLLNIKTNRKIYRI